MTRLQMPRLQVLSEAQMQASLAAAVEIRECYRVLRRGGLNVVGEVLRGQGAFYEMDHYPKEDVYDRETACQYYYHAHREDHREHGHFHLFLRAAALPAHQEPAAGPRGEDRVAHVVAIAMDAWGFPTELFTVNRWVTDESWLPAATVVAALDRFAIDHAYPSWPVNRWLTAMVRCFRPQIEALLYHREAVLAADGRSLPAVLEDRSREILGSLAIDVESWTSRLQLEQQRRRVGRVLPAPVSRPV